MTTSVAEPERPGAVIFKAAPVPGPRTYGAGAGAAEKSGRSATLMAAYYSFIANRIQCTGIPARILQDQKN